MRLLFLAVIVAILSAAGQTGFAQTAKSTRDLESDKKPTRVKAIAALASQGKGAISSAPALKALVERELDRQVALQAVQALTQIGASRHLQALLKHHDLPIRMQAVMGLALVGPAAKNAVPDLLRLLDDDLPVLRCLAAQALAEIGLESETETRALIKMLADPQPEVRPHALMALMNLGTSSVPALEKVLDDAEPIEVRTASLQALANQGPGAKQVVPKLIQLLKDPDAAVRAQSAATLAAIGGTAKDALPALFERLLDKNALVQAFAFRATLAVGQDDRRALSAGLKSANAIGRWAVPPESKKEVQELIKKLSDKDTGTRIAAALALGQIGKDAEPAIGPLVRMLKDENKHVQNAARQALAQLDQKNAETYLKKLRIEQQQWLRDAKSQLKFAVDSAKLVQRTQLAQLMINDPQARMQLLREKNGYQKFSVVIRNSSQQAYLRQLIRMHLAYSVMKNPPPDAVDWVSDQISDSDVEAVPALVEGLNLGLKYKLGFV